jgi:hypothetical protein
MIQINSIKIYQIKHIIIILINICIKIRIGVYCGRQRTEEEK